MSDWMLTYAAVMTGIVVMTIVFLMVWAKRLEKERGRIRGNVYKGGFLSAEEFQRDWISMRANGTTDVTVQTDPASTQCAWEAPTVIPFAADAAGNLTGPSADAVKIVNKSVFPIHVTNVSAAEQSPFKLVADVTAGTDTNAIQFNLVNGATDIAAATGMNTAALENFDMGYAGAANDNLTFDVNSTQGKIARTTVDLSTAQKAATVSWTVAAGSHANA